MRLENCYFVRKYKICSFCGLVAMSSPTHFDEIGDCDENLYIGNKKVFTLRAPFRQTEQTFVFPMV